MLVDGSCGFTCEGCTHRAVQLVHREARCGQTLPVVTHRDLGQSGHAFHLGRPRTRNVPHDVGDPFRVVHQGVQVGTVDLDRDVLAHTGHQFVEAHLDGLVDLEEHAGDLLQGGQQRIGQGPVVVRRGPGIAWVQQDHHVGLFGAHQVGGYLGGAALAHHHLHLGEGHQPFLHQGVVAHTGSERAALRQDAVEGEVPFLQLRDELPAHAQEGGHGKGQQSERTDHHPSPEAQRQFQRGPVGTANGLHHPVAEVPGGSGAARHEQRAHHGHVGQAQDDGTQDRVRDRLRHGPEHLPFHPAQRQDGQVHDQDDQLAEGGGVHHAAGGAGHLVVHPFPVQAPAGRQVLHAVQHGLHDDHRPVHDQAEVDGAQAHQVAGHTGQVHHDQGEEHGQRDHRGHDEAGTPLPEKEHEHQHHDQRPFQQVLLHGGDGPRDEVGPVQEGIDLKAFRQRRLHALHPLLHGIDHLAGVLTLAHHHDAADHLALAVAGHGPVAGRVSQAHLGHIPYEQGRAFLGRVHHDPPDVVQRAGQAQATDVVGVVAAFDVGPAGVGVVALQGGEQVANGEPHALQAKRVHRHFELLQEAPEAVDLRHARRAHQAACDDPVLHLAQLHGREPVLETGLGMHHVLVHLAQAGAQRREVGGLHAVGHVSAYELQALGHQLTGEVGVEGVVEHHGHLAHAEARDAAQLMHLGQVAQGLLDGVAHELLHLQGGQGGCDGDHLHLVVGDVGHRVHGQAHHGAHPEGDQQQHTQPDNELVLDGIPDDPFDHGRSGT